MSDNKSNGGPAFPATYRPESHGMTLRDWFAGLALMGILASPNTSGKASCSMVADDAYAQADSMLAKRSRDD